MRACSRLFHNYLINPVNETLFRNNDDSFRIKTDQGITGVMNEILPVGLVAAFAITGAPNPFAQSTGISFTLPATSDVWMDVYNALGELVTTIDGGTMSAGRQSLTLDGSRLTAGTYRLQLRAGSLRQSGVVVLVR